MNRKTFLGTLGAGAVAASAIKAAAQATAAAPAPSSQSPLMADLTDLLNLDDVEARARALMLPAVFDFVAGGAADELTIARNRAKYRDLCLQQRVLADVANLDCSTTVLGQRLSMPIILAPTSNHRFVHPEGELATARGAGLASGGALGAGTIDLAGTRAPAGAGARGLKWEHPR